MVLLTPTSSVTHDYRADVKLPWYPNDGGAIAPFQGAAGDLVVDMVRGAAIWRLAGAERRS